MEIQLLLETLATNVHASLTEFESLRKGSDSAIVVGWRPPGVTIDHRSALPGVKRTDTRLEHVTLRDDKVRLSA